MRKFYSYGPIDSQKHYYVPRKDFVDKCSELLIGTPEGSGSYFTLWGARQTGKTWLFRQSLEHIKRQFGHKFCVGEISMKDIVWENDGNNTNLFFSHFVRVFKKEFSIQTDEIQSWGEWIDLFARRKPFFDLPLILAIDEFHTIPLKIMDNLLSLFREMYLNRTSYLLHGLVLVSITEVLGGETKRGSPFNIQRSFQIANLSSGEVNDMFDQYQEECSQHIEPDVVEQLYQKTQGQPGLVGWFGELLTETYNQPHKTIDIDMWNHVYLNACESAHHDTVQHIINKALCEYSSNIIEMFTKSSIHFSFNYDWCRYMYNHGIIRYDYLDKNTSHYLICRFTSPFIQSRLYNAFTEKLKENQKHCIPALDPLDTLDDVFSGHDLNIPALVRRFKDSFKQMIDRGENARIDLPGKSIKGAGLFHLYYWLSMALRKQCEIRLEFSTGYGRVDLHLLCKANKKGLIEVKSFVNAYEVKNFIEQAAKYALKTNHASITVVMFAPFNDEKVLSQLSVTRTIDDVTVYVVAIGQG